MLKFTRQTDVLHRHYTRGKVAFSKIHDPGAGGLKLRLIHDNLGTDGLCRPPGIQRYRG